MTTDDLLPEWERGLIEAAKRCSDAVRLHIVAGNANRWACISLEDGKEREPGTAYDSRTQAIRMASPWEDNYAYVCIPPDDMPPRGAYNFLKLVRQTHAAGMKMADPEREYHAPQTTLDAIRANWTHKWNGN